MRTKILLDTDIGTNIDDALCLACLLAQPAFSSIFSGFFAKGCIYLQ